jgi:hypothetical protein
MHTSRQKSYRLSGIIQVESHHSDNNRFYSIVQVATLQRYIMMDQHATGRQTLYRQEEIVQVAKRNIVQVARHQSYRYSGITQLVIHHTGSQTSNSGTDQTQFFFLFRQF